MNALEKFFRRRRRRRRPPGFGKWTVLESYYGIGASGVRGSIRLVFRSTDARILLFFPCRKKSNIKQLSKRSKTTKTGIAQKNPLQKSFTPIPLRGLLCRSEGFALTGYDIPGCMEDGAWMRRENSSVVAAVAAAAVAHPDLENGNFSSFITESELPECADRSVSSKRVPPAQFLRKVVVGKNQISNKSGKMIKNGRKQA